MQVAELIDRFHAVPFREHEFGPGFVSGLQVFAVDAAVFRLQRDELDIMFFQHGMCYFANFYSYFAAFYLILGALCWLAGLGNKKPRDENK